MRAPLDHVVVRLQPDGKPSVEHQLGDRLARVRRLARLKILRQIFLAPRLADGGHRLDGEVIGNAEHGPRPRIVEAGHPVHDQSAHRPLQRQVLPRRAGVVGVRDERLAGLLVRRPRDEQQQRRGPHAPDLVPLDEQIEEQRPLLRVAPRVEDAPGMAYCPPMAPTAPPRRARRVRPRRSARPTSRGATSGPRRGRRSDGPPCGPHCL